MKSYSDNAPTYKYHIDKVGHHSIIRFLDTVIQLPDGTYEYDEYTLKLRNRESLQSDIEDNFSYWLQRAKDEEYNEIAQNVRTRRNALLSDTDKNMCIDRLGLAVPETITEDNVINVITDVLKLLENAVDGDWAEYRQKLRDITKQEGFPYIVEFPKKPE